MTPHGGLSLTRRALKRALDITVALLLLGLTWWIMLLAATVATLETWQCGFFVQKRVGRHGTLFPLIKIRTMRSIPEHQSSVTTADDPRITRSGRFFRATKLDELPQLLNILAGHMSLVGPRPDVPGFADRLEGDDRIVLSVRPGITGPATLKYRDEEKLLAQQADPEAYNRDVIFPDKVRINVRYVTDYSFMSDLRYLWRTLLSGGGGRRHRDAA